jgi:hypothetical protein
MTLRGHQEICQWVYRPLGLRYLHLSPVILMCRRIQNIYDSLNGIYVALRGADVVVNQQVAECDERQKLSEKEGNLQFMHTTRFIFGFTVNPSWFTPWNVSETCM